MRNGAAVPLMMIGAVLFVSPAAAGAEDEDDPGRGVARISVVNGDVSVRRGDSGDWVAAAVNAPLVVEDTVATGPNSRAEVQFDYGNVLRMGPNAEVRISELEHRRYQMQVARGQVEFSVLRDSDADVDVSTPEISVRPSKQGRYRIHVMEGQTEVNVRSGEVEVYTPRGVERVSSGRAILVRGGPEGPEFQTVSAMPRDEFDRWSESRDRSLERAASHRYVSPDIYGVEDLDNHGRWVYDPPYGWVWVPRAGPDWAPYRHGRWVWQDWYGWTWVSHDPWGWAPYHWGRWYHSHHGWCWYPGPVYGRHYWRPALVAFFGFGVGPVHVGFGFGRVGWVPLAPYEPYYRWYGRNVYRGYRGAHIDRSVHITNVNITNVYRNARVRHAVSGVDYDGFGRGGRNIVRVSEGDIRQAGLVRGQLPVAPDQRSLRFADRNVRHVPRTASTEQRFFSRRQATQVDRVPFSEQQRAFQRTAGGEQVSRGANAGGRGWRRNGADSQRAGEAVRNERSDGDGWRRIGERRTGTDRGATNAVRSTEPAQAGAGSSQPVRRNEGGERGGPWRRFGESRGTTDRGAAPSATPADAPQESGRAVERGRQQRSGGTETPAASGSEAPVRRSEPAERSRTWRRFGDPGQSEALTPRPSERPESGGSVRSNSPSERGRTWQRFGMPGETRRTEPVRRQPSAEPRSAEPFRSSESMERTRTWSMPQSMEQSRTPRWGSEARGRPDGGRSAGRSYEMPRSSRPDVSVRSAPMSRGEGRSASGGGQRQSGGGGSESRGGGRGGRSR